MRSQLSRSYTTSPYSRSTQYKQDTSRAIPSLPLSKSIRVKTHCMLPCPNLMRLYHTYMYLSYLYRASVPKAAGRGPLTTADRRFAAMLERFVIDASTTFLGFPDRRLDGRAEVHRKSLKALQSAWNACDLSHPSG